MPLEFSTATCALRILDAATICVPSRNTLCITHSPWRAHSACYFVSHCSTLTFMALVILPMFLMALILCLTVRMQQGRGERYQRS